MIKYAAFLRAINVGGKNLIKMNELKKIFISEGCKNVSTYIQSGNVIFESNTSDKQVLTSKIEKKLHQYLTDDVVVFIRTVDEIRSIVKHEPFQKLQFQVPTKLYITFLKKELKQKPKLPMLSTTKDVEIVKIKDCEIYSITQENNGRYGFPNLFIEKEFKVHTTTRNWNTIIKLSELL